MSIPSHESKRILEVRCLIKFRQYVARDYDEENTLRTLWLIVWLLIPAVLHGQNPNVEDAAGEQPTTDTNSALRVEFKNRPSVRIGDLANIDVKAKWHFDSRGFSPPIFNPPGLVTAL